MSQPRRCQPGSSDTLVLGGRLRTLFPFQCSALERERDRLRLSPRSELKTRRWWDAGRACEEAVPERSPGTRLNAIGTIGVIFVRNRYIGSDRI